MSTRINASTFFITGNANNGVLIQLAACGIMVALLTGAPSLTFWRFRFLQYTNFAMLSIVQSFEGQVAFGETTTARIAKCGDLLYFLYVVLSLPGIRACPVQGGGCGPSMQFPFSVDPANPCVATDAAYFEHLEGGVPAWMAVNYQSCADFSDDCFSGCNGGGNCDTEPFAYWANAIGQLIIKKAILIIGNQQVDTLYNDYLFIWEELSGRPGKRLTEMIGKRECIQDLIVDSQEWRTLYVPLPFYFTQTPGNALPLVAIMFSGAQITIEFEQLGNCVIVSGPGLAVYKCNGGGLLQANDLRAALDGTQVFLDILERDRFASTWFEQLITQVSAIYQSVCCASVRIPLNFTHPVIELIWVVRRQCAADHNNWFNYSGILGRDPLVACELDFNSTARQPKREATYFRLIQPYQFHTCIPQSAIYVYSFALYPEEAQPSGAANFSRLESIQLILDLQDGLGVENVTVIVFARSLNLLKFRDGVAGVAFS